MYESTLGSNRVKDLRLQLQRQGQDYSTHFCPAALEDKSYAVLHSACLEQLRILRSSVRGVFGNTVYISSLVSIQLQLKLIHKSIPVGMFRSQRYICIYVATCSSPYWFVAPDIIPLKFNT